MSKVLQSGCLFNEVYQKFYLILDFPLMRKLVADIFDNAASLTDTHAKYAEVSTEFGASVTSVPYHPGAAKYFAEKGFDVPTK